MSGQYIGAAILFFTTIGFTALLCLPALKIRQKNQLLRFYWTGFWGFLAAIMAFSGAQTILDVLGHDVDRVASAILQGITAAFIMFVMFAWARLALKGATHVLVKAK
ncbi:MAG: hypothetical protein COA91_00625 [Robiginitomaculum sp.]|nr:MAG: hypothetical protein COA91_00625 [Robiginitomaculum sp.]